MTVKRAEVIVGAEEEVRRVYGQNPPTLVLIRIVPRYPGTLARSRPAWRR
jgi:hypothetical protein